MTPAALLILVALPHVSALIGYDCGGDGLNITSLSLLDIGTCEMDTIEPIKKQIYVQLMQLADFDKVPAVQCRVEVDRAIYYCGMHSHISIVANGKKTYIQEIGGQACQRLHEAGTINIANAVLDRITRNATSYRSATLAGSVNSDGKCSGSQYTDSYGSWDSVVVQASIKITLITFEASVKRSLGHVMLPSGTQCPVGTGYCIDSEGSETYWTVIPTDTCHLDQYDILYEGLAVKLMPHANQTTPTIYTVTTQDTTFALTKTAETNLCGYKISRTEHPKLFILETQKGKTFKTRAKITVDNLDIFSYVNSKFVYVEKHIKSQLTQLYRDIMEQKCALERQILQNALSLASIAPDEMAFRIMKRPGYTAVTLGEVIHLIKCIPVEVNLRRTEECHNELPVTHRNQSLFLLPRSRILVRTGTPRECNELLPPMYRINGAWFRLMPRPTESIAPPIIQPLTHPKWKYVSPTDLATSGIYSSEDLDRLRTHIMFPVEKPSMLNNLARGAMGGDTRSSGVSLLNLLDEKTLDKIAESAGAKLWNGFMTFGSASAGVLAIILVIRLAKLIVDTIIHGYALHSVYGWSLHLLGAVWSSVTHLLIHLGGRPTAPPEDIENTPKADKEQQTPPNAPDVIPRSVNEPSVIFERHTDDKNSYTALRRYIRETENATNT